MQVKESYRQARKARRKPPVHSIHIRFYEDLTKQEQLQKAIQYIEDHYDEQLTISDVAKYINFSATHFSRLLKKETGRNFVDYVAFTRIIKSMPYLRKYDYTIEKISFICGFNTPNYFSLTFKKYVGISRQTTAIRKKYYLNSSEYVNEAFNSLDYKKKNLLDLKKSKPPIIKETCVINFIECRFLFNVCFKRNTFLQLPHNAYILLVVLHLNRLFLK
ncbi:helix-turn-helix transcriptional regulator [Lysinibacillus xylanilyticus]|uniref:helix-turn-helix transcriptional regulator n=1 Tax=Lysinibacillus xylanilyticus TaxID=582475 RepID=UPI0038288364